METINLPTVYLVKYLGCRHTKGLHGIEYTKKPTKKLVRHSKGEPTHLEITKDALIFTPSNSKEPTKFPIDTISYGVSDLTYTNIFSIIVIAQPDQKTRSKRKHSLKYMCHAFECESQEKSTELTKVLQTAFRIFNKAVKEASEGSKKDELEKIEQYQKIVGSLTENCAMLEGKVKELEKEIGVLKMGDRVSLEVPIGWNINNK